ncbi:GSCOCG00008025001-RA-CDS [Cotesia congregata]|nr:GSCOCG00008025001-RA-CDS [Cotesia congregata]
MCENEEPENFQLSSKIPEERLTKQDSRSESPSTGAKPKKKPKSRRRLNALMSNVSIHFSDTDSEGELTIMSSQIRSLSPLKQRRLPNGPVTPIISVTLENADSEPQDLQWDGLGEFPNVDRRNSFAENLTDVDEIYMGSDQESSCKKVEKKGLTVMENNCQGETDLEDVSNDEDDPVEPPILLPKALDILREFGGGTITTKEGDGPFSIEVRRQMSVDEEYFEDHKKIDDLSLLHGGTDTEDIDASDEEEEIDGACGQKDDIEDFDLLAGSQVIVKNVNKMEDLLSVRDPGDDGASDGLTDVEDFE